ncbi:FMRFamide receptor-like [Gigantopelta aegis]|uniref:FMRFamide receptor-like n=1 Tax=Gigantopelta aegis TaxID=1735272 RepID=UPI001B88B801|nr:FMRFamide receptor-like [Gigantopelta aegis]
MLTENSANNVTLLVDFPNESEVYYIMEVWYYVHGICGTSVALFGLIGNTIAIFVLSGKRMRSSTTLFLIVLAIFDNVLLLFVILLQTLPIICQHDDILIDYMFVREMAYMLLYPVVHICHTGTIYTTIAVTGERCIAIVKPLGARSICTRSRAGKIVIGIMVWSIFYNIPRCLENELEVVWDPMVNQSVYITAQSTFGNSWFYNYVYLVCINCIFHFLLPFLALSLMNYFILKTLWQRKRGILNQQRAVSLENDYRLTAVVLAMTTVFFICQLFGATQLVILQANGIQSSRIGKCTKPCEIFKAIAETVVIVNSAINFILFCVFGNKFRQMFLRCICISKQRNIIRMNTRD